MQFLIVRDNLRRKVGNMRRTSTILAGKLGYVSFFAAAKCQNSDQHSHRVMDMQVAVTDYDVAQDAQAQFSSCDLDLLRQEPVEILLSMECQLC
jgi:hypothetical protein